MKLLWAPWRLQYIRGKKEKGCVFCKRFRRKRDRQDYILSRGKKNFVILNRFPYNNGHLMIVPYRHIGRLEGLASEEAVEMFSLLKEAVRVLKRAFRPGGFNVGMNVGEAAGAGIAGHLHLHLVPRWTPDTNFMPVLSSTRSLPEHLDETYRRLKKDWRRK